MPGLTCVVVDDDEISRLTLERYIAQTSDLTLLASLPDAMQALQLLQNGEQPADVLFLDVQMPMLSGLDLLRLLPNAPQVVLTTSRSEFAVEAFELRVVDYLVKPIEFARFQQAVMRLRQRQTQPAAAAPSPPVAPPPATAPGGNSPALFVKANTRLIRVPLDEILYIEAVTGYAVVVTKNQQILSNQSIKELADRLPSPQFERVHRSYVINRERIESVEDNTIFLVGGRAVPIGKTYLTDFLSSLKA